jgi:hypothetical protein
MSAIESFISCNAVQTDLTEAWAYDNLIGDATPIVDTLLSPINREGFIQNNINFRPSGKKAVEVIYGQRTIESDINDGGLVNCTSGSTIGETSTTYEIGDTGGNFAFSYTLQDLQTRCQADRFLIAKRIRSVMDAILAQAETNGAIFLLANAGNFASDVDNGQPAGTTTQKQVSTILANGQIDYNAIESIAYEYQNNGFNGQPIVFGNEPWLKYYRALGAACCGLTGVDAGTYFNQNSYLFAQARKIAANGGPNEAIVMAPRACQMITYNEFSSGGGWDVATGTIIYGTLMHPDPRYANIMFDYSAELTCSGTTKTWTFRLALNYDFIAMPINMYQTGDRLEGVNGILNFIINNP